MSKLSRVASAMSFAHLAGIGSFRSKKARVEDEDDEKDACADEDQDDEQDRDSGDSKRSRKAKGAKGSKADEDDKMSDDDDDEEAEGDEDEKTSRKAKGRFAAGDDDDPDAEDDDDEMRGKSAVAQARRRERARCAAIFGSRHAANNPVLAASLAFNTSMTRQEALDVLRDTPAGAPAASGRSNRNPQLGAGGDQAPSRQVAIANRWDRAMSKVIKP